jgi:hypothetical protein
MARRLKSGNRLPGWLILLLTGALVGVVALPFGDRASAMVPGLESKIETPLTEFRSAIRDYAQDHDEWPGALGEWQLRAQLLGTTDATGRVGSGDEFVHGPYLPDEVPLNPATRSRAVQVVGSMPESPSDQSGWIYSYETGEVRADSRGYGVDGRRDFDL